jgi:S1-C subfamily serine protease
MKSGFSQKIPAEDYPLVLPPKLSDDPFSPFRRTIDILNSSVQRMRFLICGVLLASVLWTRGHAETETATGTAFAVSEDGDLITNEHVVSGCTTITVHQGSRHYGARILARDTSVDLAIVQLFLGPSGSPAKVSEIAMFRQSPTLRAGEQAISYGFPLTGALTMEGNLTIGNVSALRGLGDDPKYIQITTPIQPGNSGGPLLDSSGNVIGVVAAKLDAIKVMRAIGDVPQNVNFAVELATVKRFLAAHGVRATLATPSGGDLRPADIGERAKFFTYLIECETESVARLTTPAPPVPVPQTPRYADLRTCAPIQSGSVCVIFSASKDGKVNVN